VGGGAAAETGGVRPSRVAELQRCAWVGTVDVGRLGLDNRKGRVRCTCETVVKIKTAAAKQGETRWRFCDSWHVRVSW